MNLFDAMLGNLRSRQAVVGLAVFAALIALAAVAWWRSRRVAVRRPHAAENRAWTFCPKCGWPRPAASDPPRASDSPLPSDLLRRGWTRSPALDRDGRVVFPSDERAIIVAWSLWGAGNALTVGSPRWNAWIGAVTEILAERHGGMSVAAFNRHPGTSRVQVLKVAHEAERRAGLSAPRCDPNATTV